MSGFFLLLLFQSNWSSAAPKPQKRRSAPVPASTEDLDLRESLRSSAVPTRYLVRNISARVFTRCSQIWKGMAATRSETAESTENLFKCMICNQEIKNGDTIRKEYRCGHFFHEECLDMRFKRSFLCPTCRAFILKPPELPDVIANITDKRLLKMRQEWATQAIKNDRRR